MTYKHLQITGFFLLLFCFGTVVYRAQGAEPYFPERMDPLSEPWRWKQFSRLEGKGVRCLTESPDGRVWFGGDSTLFEYDGYQWIEHNSNNGLLGSPVTSIHADSRGRVFAATAAGLFLLHNRRWEPLFQPKGSPSFTFIQLNTLRDGSLLACTNLGLIRIPENRQIQCFTMKNIKDRISAQLPGVQWILLPEAAGMQGNLVEVSDVLEDPEGKVWLAITRSNELGSIVAFHPNQIRGGALTEYDLWTSGGNVSFGETQRLLRTSEGSIWVVNNSFKKGIHVFDGKQWSYTSLGSKFGGDEYMTAIAQSSDGAIWIGSLGKLYAYKNGQWSVYKAPEYSIPANKLLIRPSKSAKLWVAGINSKVFLFDYSHSRWITYKNLNFQCETAPGSQWFLDVKGRAVEKRGDSWIAYTQADGLMDAPVRLIATRKGQLWAAGSHQGIAATAWFEDGRWTTQTHPALSWGIDYRAVFEAADGSLWFGASVDMDTEKGHRGGLLHLLNPLDKEKRFIHLKYQEKGLNQSNAYGIGQTNDGRIWIGGGSLVGFDGNTWSVAEPQQLRQFVNVVSSKDGLLLAGSRSYGIFLYDGKQWRHFNTQNGLASNTVISIAARSGKEIFAATENDICRFDGSNWVTHVFPDALNMDFEGGSIQFSTDGAIWINKSRREWKRRAFSYNRASPEAFQHFVAYRYLPNDKGPETYIESYTAEVPHSGNTLISWGGEDYFNDTPDERLMYSYRLNNGPWSPFTLETYHTFTGLKSGKYALEIRARDLDMNIDPTPAHIEFRVLPPVWKQAWFLSLLAAFLLTLGIFEYRVLKRNRELALLNESLQAANDKLDRKRQQIEAKNQEILIQQQQILEQKQQLEATNAELGEQNLQIQEQRDQLEVMVNKVEALSKAKVNFFTNISHELRTPLTLILGPAEQLLHSREPLSQDDRRKLYEIIERNAFRLLKLINQLLEVRRIESNTMELSLVKGDICTFARQITSLFDALAQEKGIALSIQAACPDPVMAFDPDKVEKILVNLLSNAFKNTTTGQRISVRICQKTRENRRGTLLEVEDTGAGIAAKDLEHIFERYFSANPGLMSTGIGLSYIKDLVELLQGSITAQSAPGAGARFSIWLPDLDAGKPLPLWNAAGDWEMETAQTELHSLFIHDAEVQGELAEDKDQKQEHTLLIVEDNEDLLSFLEGITAPKYAVLKARNGREALEMADQHNVDLILSDIIMPEMDGLAFCQAIKSNILTSHIPLILLTAKALETHKMEGYHTGADDYITKPFNPELLLVRIGNLLEQRQNLREKYARDFLLRPKEIQVTSPDEALLLKLNEIMEAHISDSAFNVNKMCEMVHLSHMHFIRKVKQLTGKKPIDLLKSFRLQRAKELLRQNKINVAEIAYMVGYDLPNSFSRAFKKEFGLTPSEYLESLEQIPHKSR